MSIALLSRTVILLTWLVVLVWHAEPGVPATLLAISLIAVWAAALVRDRLRAQPGRWVATKAAT